MKSLIRYIKESIEDYDNSRYEDEFGVDYSAALINRLKGLGFKPGNEQEWYYDLPDGSFIQIGQEEPGTGYWTVYRSADDSSDWYETLDELLDVELGDNARSVDDYDEIYNKLVDMGYSDDDFVLVDDFRAACPDETISDDVADWLAQNHFMTIVTRADVKGAGPGNYYVAYDESRRARRKPIRESRARRFRARRK